MNKFIVILFLFAQIAFGKTDKDSLLKRDFHLFIDQVVKLTESKLLEITQQKKGEITKRLKDKEALKILEITKKYGYLSYLRVKNITGEEFNLEQLNFHLLFQCFPEKYKKAAYLLLKTEYKIGNIERCDFGFLVKDLLNVKDYTVLEEYGIVVTEEIISEKSWMSRFECLDK
ncbi:MAG: hypothetical protein J0M25_02940 [Flavobacteriales bacterium]|nr:hypothetical protein [Flavobacteriales bacterium]